MLPSGYVLYKYHTLDSTNAEALRLLSSSKIKENTVITAEQQTAGQGRNGKTWISHTKNLYFSILIKRSVAIQAISQLAFVAAIAVGESVEHSQYKWPNDILLYGKKFCGILLEHHHNEWVIVGIGININNSPSYATHINKHSNIDRDKLLCKVINHFDTEKMKWTTEGFQPIRKKWLSRAWGLNDILKINRIQETIEGEFIGLDHSGQLLLHNHLGVHKVSFGEVFM